MDEVQSKIQQASNTKAKILELNGQGLTELPPEIGQLTDLTELYLGHNDLIKLPAEIGQLKNLTELDLAGNKLTKLPSEIGKLIELTNLDLDYNALTELPAEIGQLKNLTHLDIYKNKLTELPQEINNLIKLEHIDVSGNQLTPKALDVVQRIIKVRNIVTKYLPDKYRIKEIEYGKNPIDIYYEGRISERQKALILDRIQKQLGGEIKVRLLFIN